MRKRAIVLCVCLALCLVLLVSLYAFRPAITSLIRHRFEGVIEEHFKSRAEFEDFQVTLYPGPHITVRNLMVRYHGRQDIPPLLQIAELSLTARLPSFLHFPVRITSLRLSGLKITLPPSGSGRPPEFQGPEANLKAKYPVAIDLLQTNDAEITLLREQPGKPPLIFTLHHLELQGLNFEKPAKFKAALTNAVPKGEIEVTGLFGPWNGEAPRATLMQADYHFDQANLATIKGLKGILNSTGSFSGPLDYLSVKGVTDIPDFTLTRVGSPLALHTNFMAIVDGTNGNTYLQDVTAHFLHSMLSAKGEVVDMDREIRGRTIHLEVESQNARIEDLIRLAAKADEPILSGAAKLTARIDIPEKDVDLSDRLEVVSRFSVEHGQFTNPDFQAKVDSLSRKGQGEPKDNEIADVPSYLAGTMRLKDGVIHFSTINFNVPGAKISLHGDYALDGGALNFQGELLLDAKLSQTTTGPKSVLLKALDPFFSNGSGGSKIHIRISGTRDHPQFGLDHGGSKENGKPDPNKP